MGRCVPEAGAHALSILVQELGARSFVDVGGGALSSLPRALELLSVAGAGAGEEEYGAGRLIYRVLGSSGAIEDLVVHVGRIAMALRCMPFFPSQTPSSQAASLDAPSSQPFFVKSHV